MTRSRAQAIRDKVNSLLTLHTFDVAVNGVLPHGTTLCVLRCETPMDLRRDAKDDQEEGQDEAERDTEAGQEVQPRDAEKTGVSGPVQAGVSAPTHASPSGAAYRGSARSQPGVWPESPPLTRQPR